MSRQRRSYYALKCAAPDCVKTTAPDFTLGPEHPFTLGAAFFPLHRDGKGTLIRQEGIFELGMENGAVYFSSPALGRVESDPLAQALVDNEWNRTDVVFDGTDLKLYLQGILSGEAAAVKKSLPQSDTVSLWQMGLMNGYLQETSLYAKALTGEEVLKSQFAPVVAAGSAEIFIDFDSFVPVDTGHHSLPVRMTGRCDTVNLAQGLKPGERGCAFPVGSSDVNPGGDTLSTFTLLVKCYPERGCEAGDTCLVANGRQGDGLLVELGLSQSQTTPFFQMCGQRFKGSVPLTPDSWNDVAVTVSDSAVKLYIDGKDAGGGTLTNPACRVDGGELTFGNLLGQDRSFQSGFQGWIDSVAVFSKALTAEKLSGYADIAPFLFDDKLKALWAFYEDEGMEMIQNGIVSYAGGAKVELSENTVRDRTPLPLVFAMPDTPSGADDVVKWQARTTAEAVCDSIQSVTGLAPVSGGFPSGTLNGSVESRVIEMWGDSTQMVNMETRQQCSAADLAKMFGGMVGGAALGLSIYAFYCTMQNKGYRRVSFVRRFFRFFSRGFLGTSGTATVLESVGSAAGILTAYLASHPSPDTEEGTCSDYSITLKSLSFYNEKSTDAGALCLRPDFDHSPVLPEWSPSGETAPALYHGSAEAGKIPVLRAVFHIVTSSGCKPVIKISATAVTTGEYSDLLGSLPEKSVVVSATGDVTVDFELKNNHLRERAPGEYKIKWNWVYDSRLLGGTEQTVYLLHAAPLSPWTTAKDSAALPVQPLVKLCCSLAAQQESESDAEKKFVRQFADWAQSGGRLTVSGWDSGSSYAWWNKTHRKLSLDGKKFTSAVSGSGKITVDALDTACLQLLLARMEGFDQLRLCFCKTCYRGLDLRLRGGKAPGGVVLGPAWQTEYPSCCIPESSGQPEIYDAFLQLKDSSGAYRQALGIPFCGSGEEGKQSGTANAAKYRTLLCADGTFCRIVLTSGTLLLGSRPLTTIVPTKKIIKRISGRPNFDPLVKKALQLPPSIARCHSISYDYIEDTIVNIVNLCLKNKLSDKSVPDALFLLWKAVTLQADAPDRPALDNDPNWPDFYSYQNIDEVFNSLAEVKDCAQACSDLAANLNNTLVNLRKGNSDWNSSVQICFDPVSWVHIIASEDGSSLCCDSRSDKDPLSCNDDPDDIPNVPQITKEGFYLTDPNDGVRLNALLGMYEYQWSLPYIDEQAVTDVPGLAPWKTDGRRRILGSSSNVWELDSHGYDAKVAIEPVFAIVNGQWQLIYVP